MKKMTEAERKARMLKGMGLLKAVENYIGDEAGEPWVADAISTMFAGLPVTMNAGKPATAQRHYAITLLKGAKEGMMANILANEKSAGQA